MRRSGSWTRVAICSWVSTSRTLSQSVVEQWSLTASQR